MSAGIRPLRRYADFGGRSTRTELVAFYLLILLIRLMPTLILDSTPPPGHFPVRTAVLAAVDLALLCPILALWTRRLHDHGKSGWWLLLLLPGLAAKGWQFYETGFSLDPFAQFDHPIPGIVQVAVAPFVLAFFVLLLLKDDEEANRYGPNPRYDEPVVTERPSEAEIGTART